MAKSCPADNYKVPFLVQKKDLEFLIKSLQDGANVELGIRASFSPAGEPEDGSLVWPPGYENTA
jgi:hypothetical protein